MNSAEEAEKRACLEERTKQHLRQLHNTLLVSMRQREAELFQIRLRWDRVAYHRGAAR